MSKAEVKTLLGEIPDLRWVDLLIPDGNGILRGKRVGADALEKAYDTGLNFPASTVLLDAKGHISARTPHGNTDGDPDVYCMPVEGTLREVPWASVPTAQMLVELVTLENEPYFADCRHVLRRTLERLGAMGYRVVCATEMEFYLLDGDAEVPTPLYPPIPGTEWLQDGVQYAALEDMGHIEPFLHELDEVCAIQGLPASTIASEYAPGQFEVNLHHVDDPLLACDQAVLLRRAVRQVALQHGYAATFMGKPFDKFAGSGMHIHVSLLNEDGENVLNGDSEESDPDFPISDVMLHAIGGLQATMAESMAIFANTANCYRRFVPGHYAPTEPAWGQNHRQLALRLPLADARNQRIEHRVAGADANPYLVMAAVLAGIHYGIENSYTPGPMVRMNETYEPEVTLPVRWSRALEVFERGTVLPSYFGPEFHDVFYRLRLHECEKFHREVSNRDYEWYLRMI